MLKWISLISLFSIFISCEIINTEGLDVTSFPSKRDQIIGESDSLWLQFSENLDQIEANELLQITGPQGLVEGDIVWTGKTMTFTPYKPLTTGYRYNFKYQGMVQTTEGLKHQVNISIPFFAGTNSQRAILTYSSPDSGTITSVFNPVTFTFSKALNRTKFEKDFSISPSADLDYVWSNGDTQVVITPKIKWSNKKLHRWKIPSSIIDTDNIPIALEYSQTFLVQEDVTAPEVSSVNPAVRQIDGSYTPMSALGLTDLDNNNEIYIEFNEAIDFVSLSSSFSIKPDLDGHFKQVSPTKFVYIKGSTFKPEEEYIITINKGMVDISGNATPEDITYKFVPGIPGIKISSIEVVYDGGSQVITSGEFNSSTMVMLNPPYKYFGVGEPDHSLQFIINLDQAFTEEEVTAKQSFIQSISCVTTFPSGTSSPFLYNSSWNASGNILTIQFKDFKKATPTTPIYYKFKIAGGSTSSANLAGSYLLKDVYFYFNGEGM